MNDDRGAGAEPAPWEEPRGPHPPDVLERVPPLAWAFLAVAAVRLWVLVDTARLGPAPDPLIVGGAVTSAVASLAALLLPAALLIRNPDALRAAPMLAVGAMTLAVGAALDAVGPGLLSFLDSAGAGSGLAPVPVIYLGYSAVASLVAMLGLVAVGLGLDRARRHPVLGGTRVRTVVVVVAVVLVVTRLREAANLLPTATDSMAITMYNVALTGIGVATILAWAYLTIVTIHGVRAGEAPATGWRLGVVAGVAGLLGHTVFAGLSALVLPGTSVDGFLFVWSALSTAAPLSLLLAVVAGLPRLGPREAVVD